MDMDTEKSLEEFNQEINLYNGKYNPLIIDEEYHISYLKKLDDVYFNSSNDDTSISDQQYDFIKSEIKKRFPNNLYFQTVGSMVRTAAEKLPVELGSLDQKHNDNEIKNWIDRYSLENDCFVIGSKHDGFSGLLVFNNGKFINAFSRGNGKEAQSIYRHVINIPSVIKDISQKSYTLIRGEFQFTDSIFKENFKELYKNSRNMTSGCMNRKYTDPIILEKMSFIAHEIIETVPTLRKDESYHLLKSWGFEVPLYIVVDSELLTEDFLNKKIHEYKETSSYELDGVVVTVNDLVNFENLSKSSSLNPESSIKYKLAINESVNTEVLDVVYESSKNGLLKPVILVKPVDLNGVTIQKCTGNNLRFIVDNGIGPGAIIKVIRSGDVIPKCQSIIKKVEPQYPIEFDWEWNTNHLGENVEAILKDKNNPEVIFKQVLDFFTSLDVELLKDASLKEILDKFNLSSSSYDEIIASIIDMTEAEFLKILGVNGGKVYKSLHRRLENLTIPILCGSLNYCGPGIGIRKFNTLLEQVSFEKLITMSYQDIAELNGFDTKTAEQIYGGLPKVQAFLERHKENIKFKEEIKTAELNKFNVVFTEVRDDQLEKKIISMGGKVGSSVSKKTTHLIAGSLVGTSGKMIKAKELNIPIFTLESFKDTFNL